MAGRGRGMTLPSWMTAKTEPSLGSENISNQPSNNNTTAPVSSESNLVEAPNVVNMSNAVKPPVTNQQPTTPTFMPPAFVPPRSFAPPTFIPPSFIPPTYNQNFPSALPTIIPSYTSPMPGMSNLPGVVPPMYPPFAFGGQPRGPMMPPPPLQPQPALVGDPNNERSNWSVHQAQDGKKYWYNKVTEQSTFDKPFCLKSPEERSIPPCKWKEYLADGKKYYSDGKESVWEEPDDHRQWREKIEAIEAKLSYKSAPPAAIPREDTRKKAQAVEVIVEYANAAEALDAFYALLDDKKVSSAARTKEVKDLCQDDPRWNALKSTGERNQAVAEYQTKKLKQEKEQKQAKAKKSRDNFLIMLAENTKIDARTRWSDAISILRDDHRYKNIEDSREREDLFSEFISELLKKEREDKFKIKDSAMKQLSLLLDDLKEKQLITRLTIWADHRELILNQLRSTEIKGLDEIDIKRAVQDMVSSLDLQYREVERKRKEERLAIVKHKEGALFSFLEKLSFQGPFRPDDRWNDIIEKPIVQQSLEYQAFVQLIDTFPDLQVNPKEIVEKVLFNLREVYRTDRRLLRDILHEAKYEVKHDSTFAQVKAVVLNIAGVTEAEEEDGTIVLVVNTKTTENTETSSSSSAKPKESTAMVSQARHMVMERMTIFENVYDDLRRQAVLDYEEDKRKQHRREERFIELLQEYFFRSDQIDISYDDAKRVLDRHSAYDALSKSDRKRLFNDYMDNLRKCMELKTKNARAYPIVPVDNTIEEGEERSDDDMLPAPVKYPEPPPDMRSKRSRSDDHSSDDSDDDASTVADDDKDKHKKSKKDKHKKDKRSKHKKHKHERTASMDESDKRKRHRSSS